MSARGLFVLGVFLAIGGLAAGAAGTGTAAVEGDGGSGGYGGTGTTLTLNVANTGTTGWRYIVFVPPTGVDFRGGQVTAGGSAPCTVGDFVGGGGELECGEFSPAAEPAAHVAVTGVVSAAPTPCGSPIQFWVNSTGTPPYTQVGDVRFTGSCAAPPKNCDKERAAVAAAQAKVSAIEQEVAAIDARVNAAAEDLKQADDELSHFQGVVRFTGGLALIGPWGEEVAQASDRAHRAQSAILTAQLVTELRLGKAEDALTRAKAVLQKCQTGSSSRTLAHVRTTRGSSACGAQLVALAGAAARAAELAAGSKRLERTGLRLAERTTRAAATDFAKALGRPELAKYRAALKPTVRLVRRAETILAAAVKRLDRLKKSATGAALGARKARTALTACQAKPPPSTVTISENDTWTYNTATGKANVCINVATTPPQASLSASVTGPGGYTASLPLTPLHPDGTRQIGAQITQPGTYADTLSVYDAKGKQTATSTNTFTVASSPQNGPTPRFGPSCPQPTS